jgi:DNA end-binding protein Ku
MGYRALRNVVLKFGAIEFGVAIYKAKDSHDLGFHEHHGTNGCLGRMGRKNYCKKCNAADVASGNILKGLEFEDTVVVFTREEIQALQDEANKLIDVDFFTDASQIDWMLWEETYRLQPTGKSSGYALLRQGLHERGQVAVGTYTLSTRERVCVVRPRGKHLVLHLLSWADEIRSDSDFPLPVTEFNEAELEMMHLVMESRTSDFDPTTYIDGYTERVREKAASKLGHGTFTPAEVRVDDAPEDVSDMLAKLEASVRKGPKSNAKAVNLDRPQAKKAPAKRAPAKKAPVKAAAMDRHPAGSRVAKKAPAKRRAS